MSHGSITVQELAQRCDAEHVDLIDVRTPAEFQEVHATSAKNVPLESLDVQKVIAERDSDKPLVRHLPQRHTFGQRLSEIL